MANAAGHLRTNESQCGEGNMKNHEFGLDGSVTGKHDFTALGDLATIICSYDETAGYSSNSLSSYFHDIGWRERINNLVQDWLLVGQNATSASALSLGGNYGESTPSDLSFDVVAANTASEDCNADKDPRPNVHDNTLSALAAAELVRRIAQHRDLPQTLQFPGSTWRDMQVQYIFLISYCF